MSGLVDVQALAITDGGRVLVGLHSKRVLFRMHLGDGCEEVSAVTVPGGILHLVHHPVREVAWAGTYLGEILCLDTRRGEVLRSFRAHRARIVAMEISPDGRWLVTAADDHQLLLWDTQAIGPDAADA